MHDPHDSAPPWTVSMHINVEFTHAVTIAENMDAATAMVGKQVEMFVNKAADEARAAGIDMRVHYMVTY